MIAGAAHGKPVKQGYEPLDAAILAVADADLYTRPGAVAALGEAIGAMPHVASEELVRYALDRLLARDLTKVVKLTDVKRSSGGLDRPPSPAGRPASERLRPSAARVDEDSTPVVTPRVLNVPSSRVLEDARTRLPKVAHGFETLRAKLMLRSDISQAEASAEATALLNRELGLALLEMAPEQRALTYASAQALADEFGSWVATRHGRREANEPI